MPAELRMAVAYLVYAGVDIAFGPGDALPDEPPESLEGVKMVLVVYDDVEHNCRVHLETFAGRGNAAQSLFTLLEVLRLAKS